MVRKTFVQRPHTADDDHVDAEVLARTTHFIEHEQPTRRPERLERSEIRRRSAISLFRPSIAFQPERSRKWRDAYKVNSRYKPIRPTTTITARSAFGDRRRP